MGKYATYKCNNCGIIRPAYRMRKTEISYKSGKSGYSFSFNPFAGLGSKSKNKLLKSIRIHSGRSYKRNRQVWVCESNMACHKPDYYAYLDKDKNELVPNYGFDKTIQPTAKKYQTLFREDTVNRRIVKDNIWNHSTRDLDRDVIISDPSLDSFQGTRSYL